MTYRKNAYVPPPKRKEPFTMNNDNVNSITTGLFGIVAVAAAAYTITSCGRSCNEAKVSKIEADAVAQNAGMYKGRCVDGVIPRRYNEDGEPLAIACPPETRLTERDSTGALVCICNRNLDAGVP